jgi:hypothetical protein
MTISNQGALTMATCDMSLDLQKYLPITSLNVLTSGRAGQAPGPALVRWKVLSTNLIRCLMKGPERYSQQSDVSIAALVDL